RTLINNILCETFLSLMTHRDEQPQAKLESYRKTTSEVFAELKLTNLSEDDLINFLCKFYCNNFSIHDYQIFTFGDGTYPFFINLIPLKIYLYVCVIFLHHDLLISFFSKIITT